MRTTSKAVLVGVGVLAAAGATMGVAAAASDDATETPITGAALQKAESAALEHTDGSQADAQLDESFHVAGHESDREED